MSVLKLEQDAEQQKKQQKDQAQPQKQAEANQQQTAQQTQQQPQPVQTPIAQQQQEQVPQPVVQQQQAQQQQQQPSLQGVTQYQQLYHPTHQMLMPIASYPFATTNLHPALYQSDLVNFYSNLLYPSNPITYSSPKNYFQQQTTQQQQQQQQPTQQDQSSQVVTTSLPVQQQQQQQNLYFPSSSQSSQSYLSLPHSPYDFYFSPRLGKREVHSRMIVNGGDEDDESEQHDSQFDYEQDYDESRFLKIRLSLGPISIYRPFDKEEAVSCSLNLVNIDTLVSDYQNKIVEFISTEEYGQEEVSVFLKQIFNLIHYIYFLNLKQDEDQQQQQSKEQNEHNDMMFMIDSGKNADPSADLRKNKSPKQQEEMMNKVRDKSVAELIEMERQLKSISSSAVTSVPFSSSSFVAFVCVLLAAMQFFY